MIPTAQELVETPQENKNFKMAVVAELFPNSTAKVTFDGEEEASEKQYAYLSSYVPKSGDRVLMAAVGGTYVILGKVKFNASPDTPTSSPSFSSVTVSGLGSFGSISIAGSGSTKLYNCEINGSLDHNGSYIGFFGSTPTSKKTVWYVNDDAQVRAKVNELLGVLYQYGLIHTG